MSREDGNAPLRVLLQMELTIQSIELDRQYDVPPTMKRGTSHNNT